MDSVYLCLSNGRNAKLRIYYAWMIISSLVFTVFLLAKQSALGFFRLLSIVLPRVFFCLSGCPCSLRP